MAALECFDEFETWRLYEIFIHLKEDEVLKKSINRFNLMEVGLIFEERAK